MKNSHHRNPNIADSVLETSDLGLTCAPAMFSVHGPQYKSHVSSQWSLGPLSSSIGLCLFGEDDSVSLFDVLPREFSNKIICMPQNCI